MGILSSISMDVEDLVKAGFNDLYITKSVGEQTNSIQHLINHYRNKHSIQDEVNSRNAEAPDKSKIT